MSRVHNIPSADNRPTDPKDYLTLAEQAHYALQYALKADAAIPRAKSPEAREAGVKAAKKAWDKANALKAQVEKEHTQSFLKALRDPSLPLPQRVEVILANADTTVRFLADGDTVTIHTTKTGDRCPSRLTTSRDHARAEYRRLIECGYYVW